MSGRTQRYIVVVLTSIVLTSLQIYIHTSRGAPKYTDDVFYKSAGREWAQHGRLAAPEITGFEGLQPPVEQVFATYPPGYPLAFGVWTRLFGFAERPAATFDDVIHGLLMVVSGCCAVAISESAVVAVAVVLVVFTGGIEGRPDELGMALAVLTFAVALRGTFAAAALAGLFAGLAGSCSPPAAMVVAPAVVAALLTPSGPESTLRRRFQFLALCAVIGAATVLLCCLPVLTLDVHAWRQFMQQSKLVASVPFVQSWLWAVKEYPAGMASYVLIALLGAVAVALTVVVSGWSRMAVCLASLVLGYGLILLRAAGKFPYLWFPTPLVLLLALTSLRDYFWPASEITSAAGVNLPRASKRGIGAKLVVVCLCVLIAGLTIVRGGIRYGRLFKSNYFQDRDAAAAEIERLIPPGSTVIADSYWYELGWTRRYFDSHFSELSDYRDVQFAVFEEPSMRRPPLRSEFNPDLPAAIEADFVPIYDVDNHRIGVTVYRRQAQ